MRLLACFLEELGNSELLSHDAASQAFLSIKDAHEWKSVMDNTTPEVTKTTSKTTGHSWNETTATAVEATSQVDAAEVEAAILDYKARLVVHESNLTKMAAATKRLVAASEVKSKELTKTAKIITSCESLERSLSTLLSSLSLHAIMHSPVVYYRFVRNTRPTD